MTKTSIDRILKEDPLLRYSSTKQFFMKLNSINCYRSFCNEREFTVYSIVSRVDSYWSNTTYDFKRQLYKTNLGNSFILLVDLYFQLKF